MLRRARRFEHADQLHPRKRGQIHAYKTVIVERATRRIVRLMLEIVTVGILRQGVDKRRFFDRISRRAQLRYLARRLGQRVSRRVAIGRRGDAVEVCRKRVEVFARARRQFIGHRTLLQPQRRVEVVYTVVVVFVRAKTPTPLGDPRRKLSHRRRP